MLRIVAAGFMCFAFCAISGQSAASTDQGVKAIPNFVQAALNTFSTCAQKQEIRDYSATSPPDTRMELCGAKFVWRREDLAMVRKCLTRGKIVSAEKMPSFEMRGGFAFQILYDCNLHLAWLSINVEMRGNSAQVTGIGEAME